MGQRVGPNVYITCLQRSMTKVVWKRYYRYIRVITREAEKVAVDRMLYGSGFMYFPNGADPKHIPIEKVMIQR
jgi:hypothetical protein